MSEIRRRYGLEGVAPDDVTLVLATLDAVARRLGLTKAAVATYTGNETQHRAMAGLLALALAQGVTYAAQGLLPGEDGAYPIAGLGDTPPPPPWITGRGPIPVDQVGPPDEQRDRMADAGNPWTPHRVEMAEEVWIARVMDPRPKAGPPTPGHRYISDYARLVIGRGECHACAVGWSHGDDPGGLWGSDTCDDWPGGISITCPDETLDGNLRMMPDGELCPCPCHWALEDRPQVPGR